MEDPSLAQAQVQFDNSQSFSPSFLRVPPNSMVMSSASMVDNNPATDGDMSMEKSSSDIYDGSINNRFIPQEPTTYEVEVHQKNFDLIHHDHTDFPADEENFF